MVSLSKILKESISTIMVNGTTFNLTVDVNDSPTKQGIRVQFTPVNNNTTLSRTELLSQIQLLLNKGLSEIGMQVEVDTDVPYDNTIGFLIRISYFDALIKNIVTEHDSLNKSSAEVEPEEK